MTVAEIKEYIQNREMQLYRENELFQGTRYEARGYIELVNEIYKMLDELEPKAKWVEKDIQELECSNCGTISEFGLEKYCWGCGCEMIDIVLKDDKENNK